jgi:hypothetical protein
MKGHEISYRAASYDALDARVTDKLGLPAGLLQSVRTKGERTNADQVSSAGARTVYQIIPATRRAAIKQYGIDPYLSAENAAEVAGRLLSDSLKRNGGDPARAVAEYHGGTNPANHGPITRAYVGRVTGSSGLNGTRRGLVPAIPEAILTNYNTPGAMSAADRKRIDDAIKAGSLALPEGMALTRPQEAAKPDAAVIPKRVIDNFNNRSEMTENERAMLERDLADGLIVLPQGATLKRPDPLAAGQRLAMGAGGVARGAAALIDMPINAVNAAANLPFVLAGQKAPIPTTGPFSGAVDQALNAANVPMPATKGEKVVDAIVQGATQGLATAGIGGLMSGAAGITGAVGRSLAAAPGLDTVASGVAGGAAEKARQSGAGVIGQLGAALVGGGGTALSVSALERVAAKFGPKTARVIETVPEEVAFNKNGAITEEGLHYADRADVAPAELKAAYAEAGAPEPVAAGPTSNVINSIDKSRSYTKSDVQEVAKIAGERLRELGADVKIGDPYTTAYGTSVYISPSNTDAYHYAGLPVPQVRISDHSGGWGHSRGQVKPLGFNLERPKTGTELQNKIDEIIKEPFLGRSFYDIDGAKANIDAARVTAKELAAPLYKERALNAYLEHIGNGSANSKKRAMAQARAYDRNFVPPSETPAAPVLSSNEAAAVERAGVRVAEDGTVDPASVRAKASEAPPAPDAVNATAVDPNAPLPATAAARLTEATSEGVPLTKGQATQDFAAQDAEQTLKAQASGEGEKARAFLARQQEAIAGAVEKFRSGFGDPAMNATERGAIVKDSLRELSDQGRAGVSALYKQAREVAQGLGENARSVLDLDTAPLLAKMRELWIDEAVPEQVRNALRQKAAQYGLIGKNPKTVEGITAVELMDDAGKVAERIKFAGPVRRLAVDNAEDLRQTINDLYTADTSRRSQALKGVIDTAVSDAVERAAVEGQGDVGAAFKAGREAFITQKKTFGAKDVVQRLIDFKKGTQTDVVLPENAIREIFAGGPEGLTTLKKIKAVLLSQPTPNSRAAWKAIQAHGVADIFKAALSPSGDISGARLSTAIKKFGPDKLKVLLEPSDFGQLMKLQRIIKTATVPLPNTVNPSGSGYKVIQFLSQQAQRLGPVASIVGGPVKPVVDAVAGLIKTGQEASAAKAALEGVTNFTPQAAALTDAKAAATKPDLKAGTAEAVRAFIDLTASTRLIAPLIAGTAASNQSEKD